MGCFLGLHSWEQRGDVRHCKRCNAYQVWEGTIDDPDYWRSVDPWNKDWNEVVALWEARK